MKKGIPSKSVKALMKQVLIDNIPMIEFVGLKDTAELLRKASEIMVELRNEKDCSELIERLVVYLIKMSFAGWLDVLMAWQKTSYFYELERPY